MSFEVLGPLRARGADGLEVELRGTLQRRLLAALLLHRDRVVPVDRLAEMVWTDSVVPHDAGALQSQVFRLRQRMPGLEIEHRSGYVLHLNGGGARCRCVRAGRLGRRGAARR